jgi:hypothetical protein
MTFRPPLMIIGAVILALGAARPARAQSQPDTAGLVRAVASIVADSVIPRVSKGPVYILTPATPFDSAIAAILRTAPGTVTFGTGRPRAYEWVGTRGYTVQGDTVSVLVEVGMTAPGSGPIDTYIEENLHLFVRDTGGWRYIRRQFVRGMDLGPVRGRR